MIRNHCSGVSRVFPAVPVRSFHRLSVTAFWLDTNSISAFTFSSGSIKPLACNGAYRVPLLAVFTELWGYLLGWDAHLATVSVRSNLRLSVTVVRHLTVSVFAFRYD